MPGLIVVSVLTVAGFLLWRWLRTHGIEYQKPIYVPRYRDGGYVSQREHLELTPAMMGQHPNESWYACEMVKDEFDELVPFQ